MQNLLSLLLPVNRVIVLLVVVCLPLVLLVEDRVVGREGMFATS